jgi:hypothetical protein
MMMILTDDHAIELFDSPGHPPNWIELLDVENGEYQFCDDSGQRYVGEIARPAGLFRPAQWRLRPELRCKGLGRPECLGLPAK